MTKLLTHIRWMIRKDDLREVLEIEHHSFDWPRNEDRFERQLRQRNCIGMVAEYDEQVVGYVVYLLFKHKLRLINLAVHEHFRRFGVGRQIVERLKSKLSPEGRKTLQLEVRDSNLSAQLFYRQMGFKAVDIWPNHYVDGDDAYLMEYRLRRGSKANQPNRSVPMTESKLRQPQQP